MLDVHQEESTIENEYMDLLLLEESRQLDRRISILEYQCLQVSLDWDSCEFDRRGRMVLRDQYNTTGIPNKAVGGGSYLYPTPSEICT